MIAEGAQLRGHVDLFKRYPRRIELVQTSKDELKPYLGHSLATVRALEMQMAELFPDEGLDHIIGKVPGVGQVAIQANYYLGLFTSQSASTVPARTVTLASQSGVTEVANSGAYARVTVGNAQWGAAATNASGRRTTAAQQSFAESTGSWGTVNGFFVATIATHASGVALAYANFDDGQSVGVNSAGYTIRITPYIQYDG